MRLLGLEFKSDNIIKWFTLNKAMNFTVKKILPDYK